jgi:hypothetical protein
LEGKKYSFCAKVSIDIPKPYCWGTSGKPVTLETSRLMKFMKQVFRNIELAKIWNLEPAKLRSREREKVWNLEPAKLRSRERVKVWNLEPAKLRSRERAKIWNLEPAKLRSSKLVKTEVVNLQHREIGGLRNSGICWRLSSEVTTHEDFLNGRIHEPVRSKVKDVVSKGPGLVCELVAVL